MKGNLIGINTLIDFDSRGRDGLGFALEWKFVQPLVKYLIDEGNIPRVDLGIRLKGTTDGCLRIQYLEHQKLRGDESGCLGPEVSTGVGELKPGDMIVSVNGKRVYKNIDYWVEASLVTSLIGKAEISYFAMEEDVKLKNIKVSSKRGFSIPVEYLPRITDTMMGVSYLGEKLSFREVRRGCSAIGETEPCGVRIENHNHRDISHPLYDLFNRNIALIIKAKIDTLSSFINSIEDYKKTIKSAKKQVHNLESKLNNCKEKYKKIEDYDFSEYDLNEEKRNVFLADVKLRCEEWQDEFEISNQKLKQLHNLSIEVRDGDGKFSTHEFLWDPGLYIVRNIKTPG